jgi:DNA polymerase-1
MLLCIDFSNLLVRHASNPYGHHKDALGRPTWGAVGALGQVLRLIDSEGPTHLLIAKDGRREDSFRRAIDASYKAHRDETARDEDLLRQFSLAYEAVSLFSWPCLHFEKHEADDVIASACRAYPEAVEVVSGDRDMLALCSDRVTVQLLRSGGPERLGTAGCLRLLGVEPRQVRDYKALVGDKSDGIVGVEGIGPKRAIRLLDAYGSLASIYKHLDAGEDMSASATPSVLSRLESGRDSARTSWQLAGMVSDLPIDVDGLQMPPRPTWEEHEGALKELGLDGLERALTGRTSARGGEVDLDLAFRQMAMDLAGSKPAS